ncbi:MAG TPA: hypothetical protein VK169_01460 [Saprospiraceae bacterium]|nr:hypothetical protein [Saprospiraceae bacterium]
MKDFLLEDFTNSMIHNKEKIEGGYSCEFIFYNPNGTTTTIHEWDNSNGEIFRDSCPDNK